MKGHPDIIQLLNDVLTNELTAINQYFLHAKMLKPTGAWTTGQATSTLESIDEMKHADALIRRASCSSRGVPNLQALGKLRDRRDPVEVLFAADLALEHGRPASCSTRGDRLLRAPPTTTAAAGAAQADILESPRRRTWTGSRPSSRPGRSSVGEQNYLAQQLA
jgi:hypothetical protein